MAVGRCDLCDLPLDQCVHGTAKPKRSTLKKSSAAKPAKGQGRAGTSAASPPRCSRCRKRSRYGRYAICAKCLTLEGGQVCRTCG